jgi:hypothetical protein
VFANLVIISPSKSEPLNHCLLIPWNESVVDSRCTHHMIKDASLFTSLDKVVKRKIYVADDFSLNIASCGDVLYRHGKNVDVYHVPNLSENLLLVSQLTQISKIVEFWKNQFLVKGLMKDRSNFVEGFLNSKDG